MDYTVDVNPLKARFFVKEVFENGAFIVRGIACAVRFKGSTPFLLTSSAVVQETDNRKKLIAERFSRKHVGAYKLDVSVLRQLGNVTFLWIMKEYQRAVGTSWIIGLNLELPSSERKALGHLLPGTEAGKCELQVQFDGSTEVIPAESIDRASILGVPIIIENIQSNKRQSGRFSVIGVVGLTSEEKFCVCYLDHENTGSLDMLLSNRNGPEGPTNIEELVEEETSTAQTQAVAAFNLREQGPSASLEIEDQRSLRECGEPSTAQAQAVAASINLHEQGISEILETEDQRSWREYGDLPQFFPRVPSSRNLIYGQVFKAKRNGIPVAVKILKDVGNFVKQIAYYEREVDLLSKAKHPNIVGIIDCQLIESNLTIVMELVNGGNLKEFLKNDLHGAGKKEFTVRFVQHIGSAIEHLHSLNIIHRDVKPDNILLSKDQKVLKLGDFGIARATEGTEQTKARMGSYRYMAPEVGMALRCRYSKRADVYSFGLCLIEVLIQGKVVFAHIADDEAVMPRKRHGEKPQIPEISVDEFGEELATKLKGITEECLRPESSRPEMSRVLRMLRGELTANKGTVELYCIGTGTGTTAVVHGKPSSSVIIYHDGKPLLLADIGAGVLKPCMEKLGHPHSAFPRNVFISHNHMDHSGELPLLLAFESMRRYKAKEPALRVLCGPEVEHKLKTHRLDELLSTSYTPEQVAEWIVCKPDGDPTYLDDAKQFFIKIYRTLHSEVCYGFLLHFKDKPILGYLVDSGFKEDVYEFFFQASTVVVDARENGNKDHASFAEVVDYVKKHEFKRSKVYITGYGIDTEYPLEGLPEVEPLRPEQYITLWEEDMENAEH